MQTIVDLHGEDLNDGCIALVATLQPAGCRVFLGYVDPQSADVHYNVGGADRVAKLVKSV